MNHLFLKGVSFVLMLCFVIGCAGMNDSTRTRAEGTGIGAATGALLGGVLGQVIGHDQKSTLIGAAIGAAVGGGAGYLAGDYVAKRKAQYASEEDWLNNKIEVVAQYNNDLEVFNKKTANRNKQLEKQVADLKSRYDAGSVEVSVLEKKQNEINSLIRSAEKRKANMEKELADLNEDQQSISQTQDLAKVAKLGQEINILKNQIAMLDKNNEQMAQLVSSLTLRK